MLSRLQFQRQQSTGIPEANLEQIQHSPARAPGCWRSVPCRNVGRIEPVSVAAWVAVAASASPRGSVSHGHPRSPLAPNNPGGQWACQLRTAKLCSAPPGGCVVHTGLSPCEIRCMLWAASPRNQWGSALEPCCKVAVGLLRQGGQSSTPTPALLSPIKLPT